MTIIDQLEQTVSIAVLGNDNDVAHTSLLEQFYAILIMRLAQPAVYSQMLRDDQSALVQPISGSTLFEQLWRPLNQRQLLIDELAVTHHVDTSTTEQLLINAAHLAYQELKNLANGQFLPAFLQSQQSVVRPYLPVWSPAAISLLSEVSESFNLGSETLIHNSRGQDTAASLLSTEPVYIKEEVYSTDVASNLIQDRQEPLLGPINAIHASPSDYHAENSHIVEKQIAVRARNKKNDLIIRVLLLFGALVAIGLLWALVIKPNNVKTPEPIAAVPIATAPAPIEPIAVMTPAALTVGVDDGGNLYNCSATVGDELLQNALKQALSVSFGEQAANCVLTVQAGYANTLGAVNVESLPEIMTLLRSVPFARLQLQNGALTLEAPDQILLQRLLIDTRTMAPALSITAIPPALLNNAVNTGETNMDTLNGGSSDNFVQDNAVFNNSDNTNTELNNNQNYQASDDDTNDRVVPAPSRDNTVNRNNSINNTPSGPISNSEVDDLANTTIVDERLRNERPVDRNVSQNR